MGLDLHVLPISAFVVGDFEGGMAIMLRQMGLGSVPLTVIRAGGAGSPTFERVTAPAGAWGQFQRLTGIWALRRAALRLKTRIRRGQGVEFVQWLREALERVGVEHPDWCEEGGSLLTRQVAREWVCALQAHAWRLEFPEVLGKTGTGGTSPDQRHEEALATLERADELNLRAAQFPHLCNHSLGDGFLIPVEFDTPRRLLGPGSPTGEGEVRIPVGSSTNFLRELNRLKATLGIIEPWDLKEFMPSSTDEDDDLHYVRYGWKLLEGFARVSVEQRLPICFDG